MQLKFFLLSRWPPVSNELAMLRNIASQLTLFWSCHWPASAMLPHRYCFSFLCFCLCLCLCFCFCYQNQTRPLEPREPTPPAASTNSSNELHIQANPNELECTLQVASGQRDSSCHYTTKSAPFGCHYLSDKLHRALPAQQIRLMIA